MSLSSAQEDAWSSGMRAALNGDSSAYRAVLEGVAPVVRSYVYGLLSRSGFGTADADDVVQDVLLAVHLRRHTWDESLPFRPWLFAIARYKSIDWLRRKGRRMEIPIHGFEDLIPMPASGEAELGRDVQRCLAKLPSRQRQIVTAIAVDGLSIQDTAAHYGMEQGAVRVALHRGLKNLASLFQTADS